MSLDVVDALLAALRHHATRLRSQGLTELRAFPAGVLITYGDLCDLAGNPVVARGAGKYLAELAKREGSPLDALVVNKRTGLPGVGFCSTENFNESAWKQEVSEALDVLVAKS